MGPYYVGVDVGTSSVRAALVTAMGQIEVMSTKAIAIWEPRTDFYEQSSDEIWKAVCKVVRDVTQNVPPSEVHGVGFDATASLVVLDEKFQSVAVSDGEITDHNVIMWMDHRAVDQARQINQTHHAVLRNVGGTISPEMQLPKLVWLKQNLPDCWKTYGHFFDLPDFLTWKASGSLSRSLCSLVCKWTYQADASSAVWDGSIFHELGLEDLVDGDFGKIGQEVVAPGSPCGHGLTLEAARDMGLLPGTPVAASLIDAHAGGLATLGCRPKLSEGSPPQKDGFLFEDVPITSKLALICGTSTCHMIVSKEPVFVRGVWGPYYSAMVPRLWLNEGGQSSTGKLLDHIIGCHPARSWVTDDAERRQMHVHSVLNEVLDFIAKRDSARSVSALTHDLHVWPDYHGNRSPLADPDSRGMVSGFRLSSGTEDLALQYLATMQALVYGTKHIIEAMKSSGHSVEMVYICGGLVNNRLFVQLHADILGVPVVLPHTKDSVLLGAAILAAAASQDFAKVEDAMDAMSGTGTLVFPTADDREFHRRKYQVFLSMIAHQKQYREMMTAREVTESTPQISLSASNDAVWEH